MTTTTITPAEEQAWADRYKGKCADCGGPCERTALRCIVCHRKIANPRVKSDGKRNAKGALRISYVETVSTPALEPVGHVHRFVLPSVGDGSGVVVGVCACGESKEHRPWKDEMKWGGGK